jgi:hypothetical protein
LDSDTPSVSTGRAGEWAAFLGDDPKLTGYGIECIAVIELRAEPVTPLGLPICSPLLPSYRHGAPLYPYDADTLTRPYVFVKYAVFFVF